MLKRISAFKKRIVAGIMILVILSANLLSAVAQKEESRFTAEHLKAYYNFEQVGQLLADASGNNNNLAVGWGYTPSQIDADASLNLGKGAKFSSVSAVTPMGSVYNKKDFLDNMDTYTLSMFFQNTKACSGGILFNNKFWGESGVRISVNKWPDPAATGQAELYLDYNYTDKNGTEKNFRNCVKFIPDASGSVDQSWQHIALTVDKPNHTIKLYYNGALVHENSDMKVLLADSQKYPVAFGAMLDPQWPSTDSPFDGSLDEIRIYDFAATDSEADILSKNTLPKQEADDDDDDDDGDDVITEDRLITKNLKAYYNFEKSGQMLLDISGNNNRLSVGWGYAPTQIEADASLGLGKGAKFGSVSALTPSGAKYNQNDFLDYMDTYTLSMFFQNTQAGTGGILFNNKFWGESGVRVSVNKWPDPSATGQIELYFDYNYLDKSGVEKNFRNCVKFIPDISGKVDQSWQHIAVTVDKPNHTIKLYLNGELIHKNSDMKALLADSQKYPTAFGALLDPQWPDVNSPFDGSLDEIRIYNFAATDSEVIRLRNNDVPGVEKDVMGTVPVTDKYDMYTYTIPYWEGNTVYQESVLVLKNEDGTVTEKSLMYNATEIVSVRSHDLKTVYTEGTDYILKDGKLTFPEGSKIPMMSYSEYYPETYTEGSNFKTSDGRNLYYSEAFQQKQISVTYKHNDKWGGNIPSYQGRYIPKTIEKLTEKKAINIVFYGDSITEGYSASGFMGYEPYTDTWVDMVEAVLKTKYGYNDINVLNSALAGSDTVWGADDANLTPRVISKNPDLVVIAFGMNDGGRSTASYRANIKAMIEKVRAVNPDTEFLLVSSMLPNAEVENGNIGIYQNELVALQSELEGIGVARVTDAYRTVASNKDHYDISGNNYNHPNDFIVRLYAQVFVASLYGSIDNSILLDCISEAEGLEEKMFTAASWSELQEALKKARTLVDSSEQAVIDAAAAELKAVIKSLDSVNRLTVDNLLAYYNFEYDSSIGWDLSSYKNHLECDFWGDMITQYPSGQPLGGSCARFMGASIATPAFRSLNQKDFIDMSDNYSLSFFFKMSADSKGGTLYNNKNWADEGIKISTHTWEDKEAVGQVEVYLTFAYRDQNGQLKNVHQVVHFMPEAVGGGIDTSWHHIAVSVSKEKGVKFFFDGEQTRVAIPETPSEYLFACEKYTMSFGGAYDDEYQNAQECFNGYLDEIRIYNFAISQDEAKLLCANENLDTPSPKTDDKEEKELTLNTVTESGLAIQLTVPKAAVPEDVILKASDLKSGETYKMLESILGEKMCSSICFELDLFDQNMPITNLEDYAAIVLSSNKNLSGYTLYFLNEQGCLEQLEDFIDGDKLNSYSKTLGTFVLIKDINKQIDSDIKIPATGVSSYLSLALLLLFISFTAFAAKIVFVYRRKKENN